MASAPKLPLALSRKINHAKSLAYCPAALRYLEPITYPWGVRVNRNERRRVRREISDRKDEVERIREFIKDGHWPPPNLPGDWGQLPADPLDFPGKYFDPADWVLRPEDPNKRSWNQAFGAKLDGDSDATEEASDLAEPTEQRESNYAAKKARRRPQDNWNRSSISSSLKSDHLPPGFVFDDSLPDSQKKDLDSARAEADNPPSNSVEPEESLRNSQDRPEADSGQPLEDSPPLVFDTNLNDSQEDDSLLLQDAQDTRNSDWEAVVQENVSHLTFEEDPWKDQADWSPHSFHTVSTVPLSTDEHDRLHLGGDNLVRYLYLPFPFETCGILRCFYPYFESPANHFPFAGTHRQSVLHTRPACTRRRRFPNGRSSHSANLWLDQEEAGLQAPQQSRQSRHPLYPVTWVSSRVRSC